MKDLWKNFLKCGTIGWCLEILFTGMDSVLKRQPALRGTTSLWMFPIYGLGCLIKPFYLLFRRFPVYLRGIFYMAGIFGVEYASGRYLQKKGCCPWNYRNSHWQVDEVIRLDYAPCWFAAGLLFERSLVSPSTRRISTK